MNISKASGYYRIHLPRNRQDLQDFSGLSSIHKILKNHVDPVYLPWFQDVASRHERSSENQPRRNEEHEGRHKGRIEEIFVFFVSSWLIFILSGRRP